MKNFFSPCKLKYFKDHLVLCIALYKWMSVIFETLKCRIQIFFFVFIVAFLLWRILFSNYCVNEFHRIWCRVRKTETISTNSSQLNSIKKCIFHCCELDECLFVAEGFFLWLAGFALYILKSLKIFEVTNRIYYFFRVLRNAVQRCIHVHYSVSLILIVNFLRKIHDTIRDNWILDNFDPYKEK